MMTNTNDELTADYPSCVVGILAGGHSKRMGHPKALLALPDGPTFIEHVAHVAAELRPAAEEIVILGEPGSLPAALGHLRVLPDTMPDAGPLAGLASLLTVADTRWALLLACDMPFLDTPVLTRLLEHAGPEVDVIAYGRDEPSRTYHPCCALYHPRIRRQVIDGLTVGKRSVHSVLDGVRMLVLQAGPDDVRQLTNVNTPEDYEALFGHAPFGDR